MGEKHWGCLCSEVQRGMTGQAEMVRAMLLLLPAQFSLPQVTFIRAVLIQFLFQTAEFKEHSHFLELSCSFWTLGQNAPAVTMYTSYRARDNGTGVGAVPSFLRLCPGAVAILCGFNVLVYQRGKSQ